METKSIFDIIEKSKDNLMKSKVFDDRFTKEELSEIKYAVELLLLKRQGDSKKTNDLSIKEYSTKIKNIIKKIDNQTAKRIALVQSKQLGTVFWAEADGCGGYGILREGMSTVKETKDWLKKIKFPNNKVKFN
jgi:hypothetical protein